MSDEKILGIRGPRQEDLPLSSKLRRAPDGPAPKASAVPGSTPTPDPPKTPEPLVKPENPKQ